MIVSALAVFSAACLAEALVVATLSDHGAVGPT
jgi:hypothetical protein